MSEEGEFKKRINERFQYWILKEDSQELRDLIEEAKREFPTFEDCVTNEEHDRAVKDWFKKYFGD